MNETVDCPVLKKKFPLSLKPCPFCGGKPEAHKCPDGPTGQDGRMTGGWYLRCLCNSGSIFLETIWHLTLEAAVDSWNTRTVPDADYKLLASDCIFDDQNNDFVFTETGPFYTVRFKK